jgi:hypothetical protein
MSKTPPKPPPLDPPADGLSGLNLIRELNSLSALDQVSSFLAIIIDTGKRRARCHSANYNCRIRSSEAVTADMSIYYPKYILTNKNKNKKELRV